MKLPYSNKLPIDRLGSCFDDTTNAYKFYWFLAMLDSILENNTTTISTKDLAVRMIADAWYPLDYFKLSFGKQDGFKKIAQSISKKLIVDNSPNSSSLFNQLQNNLNQKQLEEIYKAVYKLLRWVPYRFIRPFFKSELVGVSDSQINNHIVHLANSNRAASPYCFNNGEIILSKDWLEYFQSNQVILRDFLKWNLVKYLQKHNPNVVGLTEKLEKPIERDMKLARQFWKIYLQNNPTKCVYSNEAITQSGFSLDHFIPWTYIAHDQIWNLIPTTKTVNSMKSNWLPSLEKYFNGFVALQFEAFHFHYRKKNKQLLEDYSLNFCASLEDIFSMNTKTFKNRFKQQISPIMETAKNLGFSFPFVYKR